MSSRIRVSRCCDWILLLLHGGSIALTLAAVSGHSKSFEVGGFYQSRCESSRPCNLSRNLACDLEARQCACANHTDPQFIYTYDPTTRFCRESLRSGLSAYKNCKFIIGKRAARSSSSLRDSELASPHYCMSHPMCEDSLGQHSRCNRKKCVCECLGQLELRNGQCVPMRKFNESCSQPGEECDANNHEICDRDSGACVCQPRYEWSESYKCVLREIKCESDAQCISESAYGMNGRCDRVRQECECTPGFSLDALSGKCIPDSQSDKPTLKIGTRHEDSSRFGQYAVSGGILATFVLPMLAFCCVGLARVLRSKGDLHQQRSLIPLHEIASRIPHVNQSEFSIDLHVVLGRGKGGIVYGGRFGGLPVAVKTLNPECRRVDMYMDSLEQEIEIFKYLPEHEHIVRLLAYCVVHSTQCFILMELCVNGSLRDFLTRRAYLEAEDGEYVANRRHLDIVLVYNLRDLFRFSQQIAMAAEFLAEHRVVHGDIACRNVLLDSKLVAKLTDFGLGRRLCTSLTYIKTTNELKPWKWSSPEVLVRNTFSTQSDVWSFGVTLWEIFSRGAEPYGCLEYCQSFPRDLYQGFRRLARPELASIQLYRLMKKCWQSEPADRIGFQELRLELVALMRRVDGPPQYESVIVVGTDGYLANS